MAKVFLSVIRPGAGAVVRRGARSIALSVHGAMKGRNRSKLLVVRSAMEVSLVGLGSRLFRATWGLGGGVIGGAPFLHVSGRRWMTGDERWSRCRRRAARWRVSCRCMGSGGIAASISSMWMGEVRKAPHMRLRAVFWTLIRDLIIDVEPVYHAGEA